MSFRSKTKVVSLAQARNLAGEAVPQGSKEACFYYTLDMLTEDFGKKHESEFCALCEPMRVMGQHREEVALELSVVLFTTFFPKFEDYLLEIKESMLQNLLRRERGPAFGSWQKKLLSLLRLQVKKDVTSFFEDIQKHLKKYCAAELPADRLETLVGRAMIRLKKDWIPEKFLH
ncbi:MAG: hypothetical protein R3257_00300 [bacterium]|nr:hypothetical protein [bacterium]